MENINCKKWGGCYNPQMLKIFHVNHTPNCSMSTILQIVPWAPYSKLFHEHHTPNYFMSTILKNYFKESFSCTLSSRQWLSYGLSFITDFHAATFPSFSYHLFVCVKFPQLYVMLSYTFVSQSRPALIPLSFV